MSSPDRGDQRPNILCANNTVMNLHLIQKRMFCSHFRNEMTQPSPQGAVANLLSYIGQDFHQLDPVEIESKLSMEGESPILINDEKVLMAFKCGRDMTIFTSKAILYIDRKGFTGKKTEFQNIPYSTILNFATESCGSFDTDSEMKLTFATPWFPNITQDFR